MPILKNIGANLPAEPGEAGEGFYDGPVPPAGVYRVKVKFVQVKENRNGDMMLNGVAEIAEPKANKAKAKFNGYGIWFNQNVTDQGAPYLNQFLNALGMSYADFKAGKVQVTSDDPPKIVRIGSVKITGENVCNLATKRGEYNGEERLESVRWSAIKDEDADDDDVIDEDEDDIEDDEDLEDDEDMDEEEDEDSEDDEEDEDDSEDEDEESDEEDDEDEESDESGYTEEDLEGLAILELKNILKEAGWTPADYKGYSRDDLVAAIVGGEDEDEDADDAEDDDEPPF